MAEWKKVIVSGSQAELNSLSLDVALPVESGGTGASTLTDGGVLLGSGTGAVTALGQATNGQLVIGSTGADPVLSTLTQGANITITNSAGGIEIAASGLTVGTVTEVDASGTVNGITLTTSPAGGITETGTVILGGTLGSITNTQLSTAGQLILGSTTLELGETTTTVADLTLTGVIATGSFSGSFVGTTDLPDLSTGAGLTGGPYDGSAPAEFSIPTNGITNGMILNSAITIAGTSTPLGGSITLDTIVAGSGIISGSSLSSPNQGEARLTTNGVAGAIIDLGLQETDSVTFGALAITNDAIIGGDLTVNGTTTSINTTNLDIEDQFILLNSGSSAILDSGIVFGGTNGVAQSGAATIWDASYNGNDGRLAIVNNMASDATGNQTPSYHIAGVFQGTEANAATAQVDHPGNIRIESDEIYIYI
tara:strand:+ start:2202 stop:3473 length:1272 start_codon:yes stop_codon:yes gene_type:complete